MHAIQSKSDGHVSDAIFCEVPPIKLTKTDHLYSLKRRLSTQNEESANKKLNRKQNDCKSENFENLQPEELKRKCYDQVGIINKLMLKIDSLVDKIHQLEPKQTGQLP